jgi:hypothetical protein
LSEHLHRAGISPGQAQAEAAAVKLINRAVAIKNEIARRQNNPQT